MKNAKLQLRDDVDSIGIGSGSRSRPSRTLSDNSEAGKDKKEKIERILSKAGIITADVTVVCNEKDFIDPENIGLPIELTPFITCDSITDEKWSNLVQALTIKNKFLEDDK